MSERVLVTGAAGFIGSHACEALLAAGYQVIGLDNFDPYYPRAVKQANLRALRALAGEPDFRFVEADIRDPEAVSRAVAEADVVVHLAARAGVRASFQAPGAYRAINVTGTARLLAACARAGVRRVVFGSSSSVYGVAAALPFREDCRTLRPVSPYGATKRAGEQLCQRYARAHGFRIAVLRLFSVYGPRQRPDLVVQRFTRRLLAGRSIPQYGDGSSQRDYTYVADAVRGIAAAVRWTGAGRRAGAASECQIFNLAGGRPVRLDELIALLARAAGVVPRIQVLPPQPGELWSTAADLSRARRVLGYHPQVSLEEGLAEVVSWCRRRDRGEGDRPRPAPPAGPRTASHRPAGRYGYQTVAPA